MAYSRFNLALLAFGVATKIASAGELDPIRLEAESAALSGTSVSTAVDGFSGSGYVTGFTEAADRVSFDFEALEGVYDVTIGFRSESGEKGFNGGINGVGFSGRFDRSASFSEYHLGPALLVTGANMLWIGGGWSYYEIDYVQFVKTEPPPLPLPVDPTLVDPDATDEARDLMETLVSLYGKATLSGQQDVAELAVVHDYTGRTPAILGGDFMDYSPSRLAFGSNPGSHTEDLIAAHEAGHIVTISWHWNAPSGLINEVGKEWWRGFYTDAATFDLAETLADKEGENFAKLISDIDAIAVELIKLSDANVPVLWRPLHESDGAWFWWGASGRDALVELWRILFDRLVNHHDLHNLIWVQTIEDLEWYAGDEYVDILGIDAYPSDVNDPLTPIWNAFLDRFDGKRLISLSEFGTVPDVVSMRKLGVYFSYFMSWSSDNGADGYPDKQKLRDLYNAESVITLDEMGLLGDADGDGLTGFEEMGYGSSDNMRDSNSDGIEDGEAVGLGFSPMDDLSGYIAFQTTSAKQLVLLIAQSPQAISVGLSEVGDAGHSKRKVTLEISHDLEVWTPVQLKAEQFFEADQGAAELRLDVSLESAKVFFRYSNELLVP